MSKFDKSDLPQDLVLFQKEGTEIQLVARKFLQDCLSGGNTGVFDQSLDERVVIRESAKLAFQISQDERLTEQQRVFFINSAYSLEDLADDGR